ncbi:MAG: XdhC family protein [Opitutaceae bacterium]|nr:XdhC family protein [Opitutaceae bacterium]
MAEDLLQIIHELERPSTRGALVTLVAIEGSSYRRPGARLLWWDDGRRAGGISGGCIEADVLAHAEEVARSGISRHVAYNTDADGDPVFGLGTGCEGRLDLLIEPLDQSPHPLTRLPTLWRQGLRPCVSLDWRSPGQARTQVLVPNGVAVSQSDSRVFTSVPEPPIELWIVGAGDDVQPLERMAANLGWRIHIFDTRPALLTPSRFPSAVLHTFAHGNAPALPAAWRAPAVVLMSHRFRDDLEALATLAQVPAAYVGLLGSRRRCERLWAALEERLGAPAPAPLVARTRAPVGLHLGGDGPASIALSILSEIQAVLCDGDCVPLAHRERPIHELQGQRSPGSLGE